MMPTPLEAAILSVQAEMDSFAPGTPMAPKEGTTNWYILRSLAVGFTMLKRLQVLGVENDAAACERVYRKGTQHFGAADTPAAVPTVPEIVVAEAPPV